MRLRAVLPHAKVLHPHGTRLFSSGDPITSAHVKAMTDAGMRSVLLLEPGEEERVVQLSLGVEKVPRADVVEGDVVADRPLDAEGVARIRAGAEDPVTVRRRGTAEAAKQVEEYRSRAPKSEPRIPKPDTRLTQALQRNLLPVRALLAPQARVLVAVADEFVRSLLVNTLTSGGHEVHPQPGVAEITVAARRFRAEIVLVDLPDAAAVGAELRKSEEFRGTAVLFTAEEGRAQDALRAIAAGANASVPKPPRRDVLLEAVRACQDALGRNVRLRPAVVGERRRATRSPGHFVCEIKDTFLSRPLPVTTATVLDVSEQGLQIEYTLPSWPSAPTYAPHDVHPRHFFCNYARSSPLARALTVVLPAPGAPPFEAFAKFLHVRRSGACELAGLAFEKVKGSVTEHVSTIRRQK